MNCPYADAKRDLRMLHLRKDKASVFTDLNPALESDADDLAYAFDGNLISAILKSPDFDVISMADLYEGISKDTGLDFKAAIAVTNKMPLFLNGAEHKSVRTEMARLFSSTRKEQRPALEKCVDKIFDEILSDGRTIDFVSDLTQPLYQALALVLLGVDKSKTDIRDDYPRILDPIYSLNRRLSLNRSMETEIANHTDPDIDAVTKLAVLILGHDTFVGSLAIALWMTIERHPNVAFKDIPWPKTLPATSLPFTERVATRDWECDGFSVKAGQRVRVILEASAEYGPLETTDCIFGKGRHVCLGRPVTEVAWQIIIDRLKKSSLSAKPVEQTMRELDSIFCFPIKSEVLLYD